MPQSGGKKVLKIYILSVCLANANAQNKHG